MGPEPFLRENTAVTPKNELEAALVAVGEIFREGNQLTTTPPVDWVEDEELIAAKYGATNTSRKLAQRIERAKLLLAAP